MLASRSARLFALLLVLLVGALVAAGCGSDSGSGDGDNADDSAASADDSADDEGISDEVLARNNSYDAPPTLKLDPAKDYVVTLETDKGSFDIDVDPKAAPIAAANFVFLVGEGYYDGVPFHRVIKDFMVQTGDPTGTGTGGPGYDLKDDPVRGEYTRGAVAMANAGPNTGGSQFFIVHGDEVELPKDYIIFGAVDEAGMEVVDELAGVEVEVGPSGEPSQPVEMVKIITATLAD